MAAISFVKNTIFKLPKCFSQTTSQLLPRKVSRVVCFTSTSKYSEVCTAASLSLNFRLNSNADENRKREYRHYNADEAVEEPEDPDYEITKTKERAEEEKEKAKERADKAAEKAKEAKDRAAETAYEAKEKAKEKTQELKEKTKDTAGTVINVGALVYLNDCLEKENI